MTPLDSKIISMRKDKCYIRNILDYVVRELPYLDELVCLSKVLKVLDEHNMAVSRNEVLRAFNKYYNEEYHESKKQYLSWLYEEFNIKTGTITNTSNVRSQVSKKTAISQINEVKSPDIQEINTELSNSMEVLK